MKKTIIRIYYLFKGVAVFKDWNVWLAERFRISRRRGLGVFRLRNGIAFKVDFSRGNTGVFQEVWLMDLYEKFYSIKKGDVVVDIGAHIGAFSVFAAHKGATVYAYEPTPRSFELLKENAGGYDVHCFNYAVGGGEGEIKIFECEGGDDGNGPVPAGGNSPNQKSFTARAVALADVIGKIGRCDFLKIDCEGGELEILENAEGAVFEKIDNIAMEYHRNLDKVRAILAAKGYTVLGFDGGEFGYLYAKRAAAGSGAQK